MATPLVIKAGETLIPALLNDTTAARDFARRLPLTINGRRCDVDYCGSTARGTFDPEETQTGWKNGDINLAGGRFSILFDGEEESRSRHNMMIIAKIDQEHLGLVRQLPADVKFAVAVA